MIKWTGNTENVQWAQEEYRNITQTFRNVIKPKLSWTWKWRREAKGQKTVSTFTAEAKKNPKENYILMQKEVGELMTMDPEKGEAISALFAFGFSGNVCCQVLQVYVA